MFDIPFSVVSVVLSFLRLIWDKVMHRPTPPSVNVYLVVSRLPRLSGKRRRRRIGRASEKGIVLLWSSADTQEGEKSK
ncbi:MAG: hypothetical protein NZ481_09195 [Candidatus Kapabacteria bacterium]|nr:hypothetical protein [Candidatus Kapabacteria bacterium]